jgi:hypothetical protein
MAGVGIARASHAQGLGSDISITSFSPDMAVSPVAGMEGTGWKPGESTVVYPVVGVEGGFIDNVFYTSSNPTAAGVLRVLGQIGAGTLTGIRLNPMGATEQAPDDQQAAFAYRAFLSAAYDQVLSDNSAANDTGGVSLGAILRGLWNPGGKVSFGIDDNYTRFIRAANFETDANTNRDINTILASLWLHSPSSSLSGTVYASNSVDVFEASNQSFANRTMVLGGIHPIWRWLPQTTIFGDVSWGFTTGIGSSTASLMKQSSYPLTAVAGIATLLTPELTVSGQVGYTNGFYQGGPNFSAPTGQVNVGWRYSPFGRALLSYELDYTDSVNANFYSDNVVRLWLAQMVSGLIFEVQPEVHFREYNGITIVAGPPTRNDTIFNLIAGVHYNFRKSLQIAVSYQLTDDSTDYRYMSTMGGAPIIVNPSYLRNEVMLGLRWSP